jgi:hypothetical protein
MSHRAKTPHRVPTPVSHRVAAETAARKGLELAYGRFVSEKDADRKNDVGKDLIRSIFGRNAIAEDSIRLSQGW